MFWGLFGKRKDGDKNTCGCCCEDGACDESGECGSDSSESCHQEGAVSVQKPESAIVENKEPSPFK